MYQIRLNLVYSTLHEIGGNEISKSMKYFYTFKKYLEGWLKSSTAFRKLFSEVTDNSSPFLKSIFRGE